jgi:hypothetical protein
MGWRDNLEAQGRGAAQTLTGGWNDELVARLIQMMPQDDKTGIGREYAGGQYEQYRDEQRADEAESQAKHPANFATGQILGAVPGVVGGLAAAAPVAGAVGAARTLPALAGVLSKGLPAVGFGVGTGAVHGSGTSTNTGRELAKDTIRGAALGGATAAGANAVQAALPAMKALWKGGPPMGPTPALAGAGGGAAPRPIPQPTPPKAQLNMSEPLGPGLVPRPSAGGPPRPAPKPSVPPLSLADEEAKVLEMLGQKKPYAPSMKAPSQLPTTPAGALSDLPNEFPPAARPPTDVELPSQKLSVPARPGALKKRAASGPTEQGGGTPPPPPAPGEQLSFDLPGPQQGPRPGKYYATDDPQTPLSGAGESSADVFAVPGFTDKKYVVKTGPQGEVSRIFTPHETTPMQGLPEPEWVSNFGKIPYDDEAIAALRGNMPREGQGGTRLAVGYENEAGYPRVRKIATNESGRRANAYEADTSEAGYSFEDLPGTRPLSVEARKVPKPELLAPVIRGADNKFVDMQKLRRVTDKDLAQHFDLGDKRFQDVMSDWLHQGKKLPPGNPKWDPFQAELDQLRKVRPGIGDIEHARQFGIDPNDRVRLLDHGYETPPTATPKATRPSVQRELPHTEKRYNYHATAPQNVPGIAESGLDPTKSGANFPWAGKRPETFFAPREQANQARQLVAGMKNADPSEIRMLRTSRKAEPLSGKRGVVDPVNVRSTPVTADDIEIQNKKGQWVNIRDVLPKGTPPVPPEGLSGDALLKWWGSMLGMAGVSQVRMKSENR